MKEHLTAAGGILYASGDTESDPWILLIYRRGVWDLPKGKLEEGESVEECAAREVAEEVGLQGQPSIAADITHTYHEYEQQGQKFGKTTHWFAMPQAHVPEEDFEPQAEEDIEQVRWVPLKQAQTTVGFENLVQVLERFEEWYAS